MQEAIVTSAKHYNNTFTVFSTEPLNIKSNQNLSIYDKISFKDINDSNLLLTNFQVIQKATPQEFDEILNQYINHILKKIGFENNKQNLLLKLKNQICNESIEKIISSLSNALIEFLKSFITGSPIIIRFHNDGDGISGALALYTAIKDLQENVFQNKNIVWQMQRTIIYDTESFLNDDLFFKNYDTIEKALLFIIDFGSSLESINQIIDINKNYKIIWLDHHQYDDFKIFETLPYYINSWRFNGDSNITAGLISYMFSSLITNKNIDIFKDASLISDHSIYAINNENANQMSIILDFLTGTRTYNNLGLSDIYKIVNDENKMHEIFIHAQNIINEQINRGLENIKTIHKNQLYICTLDFEKTKQEYDEEYILPGRYSSKIHDVISQKHEKLITIVYYGKYISVRINKNISNYVKLLEVLKKVKESSEDVESCGGHSEAASIKIKCVDKKILNTILLNLIREFEKCNF